MDGVSVMAATARPRRVGLSKNASPLLRSVGERQYAQDRDHEEVQSKTRAFQDSLDDIHADPASSEEETLRLPPPKPSVESSKSRTPSPQNEEDLREPPGPNRKRKAETSFSRSEPEPELREPGKKVRSTALRVPRAGSFERNQAAKAGLEGNKENSNGSQAPTSSSGNIWMERFKWTSSPTSQTGKKVDYSSRKMSSQPTSNIHAAPTSTKKVSKPKTFSSKSAKKAVKPEQDDHSSEVSMRDDEEHEQMEAEIAAEQEAEERSKEELAELGLNVPTRRKANTNGKPAGLSAMDDAELEAELSKPSLQEQLGLTGTQEGSLPPSSAPQDEMDIMDSYMRTLPTEGEEDTICPLCNAPVSQESYWAFWKGLSKTVKNQTSFCHAHRRASAQTEYLAEGYPSLNGLPYIDWSRLATRIKTHRMALYNILTDEIPSAHRACYAPLALTGKAAAVPRARADLSPSKQQELETYALDSHAVYPGYYGPRGRRLITEAVMALLHTEIKKSSDPVVLTSGPATFVQAVLVPEVAVRLIMEDLECDGDKAEEIRDATFEMGSLLFEEVEDSVEIGDEEGEEVNEYEQ